MSVLLFMWLHCCGILPVFVFLCNKGRLINKGCSDESVGTCPSHFLSYESSTKKSNHRCPAGRRHKKRRKAKRRKKPKKSVDSVGVKGKREFPPPPSPSESSSEDDDTVKECISNWGKEMPYVKGKGRPLTLKKRRSQGDFLPEAPDDHPEILQENETQRIADYGNENYGGSYELFREQDGKFEDVCRELQVNAFMNAEQNTQMFGEDAPFGSTPPSEEVKSARLIRVEEADPLKTASEELVTPPMDEHCDEKQPQKWDSLKNLSRERLHPTSSEDKMQLMRQNRKTFSKEGSDRNREQREKRRDHKPSKVDFNKGEHELPKEPKKEKSPSKNLDHANRNLDYKQNVRLGNDAYGKGFFKKHPRKSPQRRPESPVANINSAEALKVCHVPLPKMQASIASGSNEAIQNIKKPTQKNKPTAKKS